MMGEPDEYFNRANQFPALCRKYGVSFTAELVPFLLRDKTTPNGVFGFKTHYDQFVVLRDEIDFNSTFPNLRYIYIHRRDLLGQAISYTRATQTNQWSGDQELLRPPWFDPQDIESRLDAILEQCAAWQRYFAMFEVESIEVSYEDVATAPKQTCEKIFDFCGVDATAPSNLEVAGIKRQADQLTEEWRKRMVAHWRERERR